MKFGNAARGKLKRPPLSRRKGISSGLELFGVDT